VCRSPWHLATGKPQAHNDGPWRFLKRTQPLVPVPAANQTDGPIKSAMSCTHRPAHLGPPENLQPTRCWFLLLEPKARAHRSPSCFRLLVGGCFAGRCQ
jgi:hypothetical protein